MALVCHWDFVSSQVQLSVDISSFPIYIYIYIYIYPACSFHCRIPFTGTGNSFLLFTVCAEKGHRCYTFSLRLFAGKTM